MYISIDLNNPKPTYLQIVEAVRRAIASGALVPGDRLPTIRDVAVQARVNRNTVSRAYLELEHQGYVQARQGSGCFVKEIDRDAQREERLRVLGGLADELALEAHLSRIPADDTVDLLKESIKRLVEENGHE